MRHTRIETELGELTLVADGDKLTGLYFPQHRYPPAETGDHVTGDAFFATVAAELDGYLAGWRTTFGVPVEFTGDPFQRAVWSRLTWIPYGQRITYGDIAAELGNPALAQAVGQAVGHNPVSIIVPCHRVVGSDGKLTGYAGGLHRKQFLLDLEESGRLF